MNINSGPGRPHGRSQACLPEGGRPGVWGRDRLRNGSGDRL